MADRASSSSTSSAERKDEKWRNRIGPWEENDLRPLDQFEPDTNFVVRAAAGSGKTTALVARMVALVRTGEAEIDDLAAITFTRKASSEMKERLYEELRAAQEVLSGSKGEYSDTKPQEEIESEKENVERALSKIQRCFVGTIHSFCGRLLREHALEAKLPPDFTIADEQEQDELRAQVWEAYIQDLYEDNLEMLDELETVGLQPDDLTGLFKTVSAHPELELYTNPPDTLPDLDTAVERAKDFVERWQGYRPRPSMEDRDRAQKALDKAEGMIEHYALDTAPQKAKLLELLEDGYSSSDEKGRVTYKRWGEKGSESKEASKELKNEAYPDLMRAVQPVLREWRAHVHDRATGFVEEARQRYLKKRQEEGLLTHHDVLYHTRNLLRDSAEVRREVYQQAPRLLVDEFQDTDPLQAEILFYLTSEDRDEENWTECTPRPGSLFIVGDDKQSIYRFRRADIEVFERVVDLVDQSGGEVAPLTKNFRSYEEICTFADNAFEEAFAEDAEVQAEYTKFTPDQSPGREEHAIRRLKVDYKYRNDANEIAEDTAGQIAGFIDRALTEGEDHEMTGPSDENPVFEDAASPEDFIIVTGQRKNLSIYGEALARAEIPFTITGSDDLGDSNDLKDFVDLLTCALRPGDELSAISFLQGGLCGFSDDDLYQVRKAFDSKNPFHFERPHVPDEGFMGLSGSLRKRYWWAFQWVKEAQKTLQEKRPGLALPEIAERVGLLASAAHAPPEENGSIRAGRLLRAFSLVRERTGEGDDWAEVLSLLRDVLDGEVEADGLTLESGADKAVQIMNLHQVKGLEAPVVFLADPYPGTGRNQTPTRHVLRKDEEPDKLIAPITKERHWGEVVVTHSPLGWEGENGFEALEERHEAAEQKRLTYVAATRAERLLIVSEYHHKRDGRKDGDWADLYLHIDDKPILRPEPPKQRAKDRPAPDLEVDRETRKEAVDRVQVPSYRTESVSEARDGSPDAPPLDTSAQQGDGYGKIIGHAVHSLLEQIVRREAFVDEVPEQWIRGHLQAAYEESGDIQAPDKIKDSQVQKVRVMVNRFLESSLAKQVEEAGRALAEFSIGSVEPGDPETVRRGIIDLVYKDDSGWHIVDYKTDRVGEDGLADTLGEHEYADQVCQYASAWKDLTGEEVASASLWFADANKRTFVGSANARGVSQRVIESDRNG